MTSPDVPAYLDLRLDDRDPQDLVDLAVADITAKTGGAVTGWPEASYEAMLVEAVALEDAEVIFAINRLPLNQYLLVLELLFQLPRDGGAAAFGPISVTVTDTTGRLVPAGTRLSLPLAGGDVVTFTTDADILIAPGASVGAGTMTAEISGAAGNGFPTSTLVSLLTPLSFVDAVTLTAATSGGRDPETDLAYATRGRTFTATLSVVLVNPTQTALFALAQPGVFRAFGINAYDPAVGPPGSNGGHITVAVLDGAGAALTAPAKATLLAALDARMSADLGVHVVDPTITDVTVTATVHALPGSDHTVVHDAVVAALTGFLSPLTWGWGSTVRRNDLIALIENVPGVDYVSAGHPTAPAADVALSGVAPLARYAAGSVITVV